jgi:hypothetical protein
MLGKAKSKKIFDLNVFHPLKSVCCCAGYEIERHPKRASREEASLHRLHRNLRGGDSGEHVSRHKWLSQATRNADDDDPPSHCRLQLSIQCRRGVQPCVAFLLGCSAFLSPVSHNRGGGGLLSCS